MSVYTTETAERTLARLKAEADFLCSIANQATQAGLPRIAEDNRRDYERLLTEIARIRRRLEDLNARAELAELGRPSLPQDRR